MNIEKSAEIGGLLQEALQYHRAGQMQKAEQVYRRVLSLDQDNSDANHLLGLIACQFGKNDIGISLIRRAIQSNPGSVGALLSLGNVLMSQGDAAGAIGAYRHVIALKPEFAEAHNNLGNVQARRGDIDGAAASFRQAIAIKPDYAEAHNNLGNLYNSRGNLDEAIASYRQAIAIKPDYAEAYNNLGTALTNHGDVDGAGAALHKAIALAPDYAEAYNNLGNLHKGQGNLEEAVAFYRKSLALKPDDPEFHNNLGLALMDKGDLDGAAASYRKALDLGPDLSGAHSNLLFTLNYLPDCSQEEIYKESRRWNDMHAAPLLQNNPVYENSRDPGRKLRIGYVSPDFRTHSVAYFIEPVIKAHDRENVEIFCYANVKKPDKITERLQAAADHWISTVGRSDREVAERIRQDRIDILVDLAGHTADNRLLVFAHKPAPVQATWLGYVNTTGMKAIHYRLTDEIADPIGAADNFYSESLIRLPQCFFCYKPPADVPSVEESPVKKEGRITFGSFNNLAKINSEVIALWSDIIAKVFGSRLLIVGKQFTDETLRFHFLRLFSKHGIDANRIEMIPQLPMAEYLAIHSKVDIALDPFPHNGHTVTCHTLWLGVPVVTLRGERYASRMSASILTQIGLTDLIAENREEYVTKAVTLAKNTGRLSILRNGMRARMLTSSLCDAAAFVRSIENAYRGMWERWCENRQRDIC